MSNFEIIKDIARARDRKTTSSYDVAATVTRIEDGIAWCHIDGGVDETPVKLTVAAHEGDVVQVRVGGGTAWLTGNGTRPPTDDAKAEAAQETANGAVEDAARASEAAASAQESADIAAQAADSAQKSADNAGEYAARALGNLSTVQSVAETLTWITQHGTMTLTADTELDPTHVYFVQDTDGDYVVGNTHYSIVKEPYADDLASYYVLTIDESLQNYVGTHLALTSEGLWILPETNGYKVLVATGSGTQYRTAGTYIIDAGGSIVASFTANGARIGKVSQTNMLIGSDRATMNAPDGSTALRILFNPTTAGGVTKYGARLTDSGLQSLINISPSTDTSGGSQAFNGKLSYTAIMNNFAWAIEEGIARVEKTGVVISGTNSNDYCLINWDGDFISSKGFDSSKPPYKWQPFVSDAVTLAANGSTTYTVTGVTLPTIDGYTRFVIPRSSKSQAVVTGFGFDENDHLTVFLRNLTSSSVEFTVRGVLMYLDNNNKWT